MLYNYCTSVIITLGITSINKAYNSLTHFKCFSLLHINNNSSIVSIFSKKQIWVISITIRIPHDHFYLVCDWLNNLNRNSIVVGWKNETMRQLSQTADLIYIVKYLACFLYSYLFCERLFILIVIQSLRSIAKQPRLHHL